MSEQQSPADTCRANGWTPGTVLVGRFVRYGRWVETVARITAVAEELVVLRNIARRSESHQYWHWRGYGGIGSETVLYDFPGNWHPITDTERAELEAAGAKL